jgi:uncharacterized protein YjiS (DUF1127 family)
MSGTSRIAAFFAPTLPAAPRGGAWLASMAGGRGPWVARSLAGVGAAVRAAWLRQRSRARIASLDARGLRDIGMTFAEAEHEANKPFWHA